MYKTLKLPFYKTNNNGHRWPYESWFNKSGWLQYPTLVFRSYKLKFNKGPSVKLHHRWNRTDRHLHNIPSNGGTMHFFLRGHRPFSKIGHILDFKSSLNKYQRVEITSCVLSSNSGIKLETNIRRKYWNHKHMAIDQYTLEWLVSHWKIRGNFLIPIIK